jgi:tRNA G18 (ribose-2'-O)-methylase SpoU
MRDVKNILIQDPSDSRLAPYSCLKGKSLERDGIFIAEGEKVVQSMVDSGCRIASCLSAIGAVSRYKSLIATMQKMGVTVYVASDEIIERIIGFRFHKGIMAVGYCPKKRTLAEVLKKVKRPLFLAALNGVNDPQNVGLIVRNAAAFGVQALIVDHETYDPYYRKSVRVSMGTIFRLPVCYENDLVASLTFLKRKHDTRVIAATLGRGTSDITKTEFSGNVCFVFGNEDKGISRKVLKIADLKVHIPIAKTVDSLNVAGASAVCLYEASRYRALA